MSDIRVPELGESIVEATVLNWLKQVGDPIQAGEAVLELETDKVNVEVMAEESGILDSVLKQAGDSVTVGETVGTVGTVGTVLSDTTVAEDTPPMIPLAPARSLEAAPVRSGAALGMPLRQTPSMRKQARENGLELADSAADFESPSVLSGRTGSTNATTLSTHAVSASPAISSGTSSISASTSVQPNLDALPPATPVRPDERRERMTRRRLTIAKRLVEAQHKAAMLTTFNEVDMSSLLELRGRRKMSFKDQHGVSLGFMSFFTKATVAALKKFPRLNAEIEGEDMILKHHYDIGVAVSTDGGLVVPVVREADRLTFAGIESEIARLATKARNNALGLEDLQGGTFTITNGGVFGSLFSTPILNAPQVGILGMHGIKQRPCAVDGHVEVRPMMYIALSYDHRIVDGAEAVQFLDMVKNLIEDPETLLLES